MKKKYYRIACYLLILLVPVILSGFGQTTGRAEEQPAGDTTGADQTPSKKPESMTVMFKGTVAEVIDAGRYVYLQIDTGEKRVWVAVPGFDGKPGDEVLVPSGVPVADFQSKKLNRKFKMIYFVGSVRRVGVGDR